MLMWKNSIHNFLEPPVMPSIVMLAASSPKLKDIQLTVIYDKWKQQNLAFEKLEPENV